MKTLLPIDTLIWGDTFLVSFANFDNIAKSKYDVHGILNTELMSWTRGSLNTLLSETEQKTVKQLPEGLYIVLTKK